MIKNPNGAFIDPDQAGEASKACYVPLNTAKRTADGLRLSKGRGGAQGWGRDMMIVKSEIMCQSETALQSR